MVTTNIGWWSINLFTEHADNYHKKVHREWITPSTLTYRMVFDLEPLRPRETALLHPCAVNNRASRTEPRSRLFLSPDNKRCVRSVSCQNCIRNLCDVSGSTSSSCWSLTLTLDMSHDGVFTGACLGLITFHANENLPRSYKTFAKNVFLTCISLATAVELLKLSTFNISKASSICKPMDFFCVNHARYNMLEMSNSKIHDVKSA